MSQDHHHHYHPVSAEEPARQPPTTSSLISSREPGGDGPNQSVSREEPSQRPVSIHSAQSPHGLLALSEKNDKVHSTQIEEQAQQPSHSTTPLDHSPTSKEDLRASAQEKRWQPGFFHNVPWLGLVSLLLVLCSIIASAIILVVSNGDEISSWKVAPSVIFAILAALSTACLNTALSSGLNISWWHQMLNGAPLTDVHRFWDHRNNLWAAVTSGSQFTFIAAATICVTVAAIEGPLLQRASTVRTRAVPKPVTLQVAMAVNVPSGYTADVTGESSYPTNPSSAFSGVFKGYTNRDAVTSGFDGCPNTCTASIPGVGFEIDCLPSNITTWTWDQYREYSNEGVAMTQFYTQTTWWIEGIDDPSYTGIAPTGSYEYLTLQASWANNTANTYTQRICNLSLAVVSYPIRITNGTTSLELPAGTNPEVMAKLPTARTPQGWSASKSTTLGGFGLIGDISAGAEGPFFSNVTMIDNGALALNKLYGLTPFAWSNPVNPNWQVNQPSAAGYAWRDPVDDILSAYHDIMFRLALQIGHNASLVPPMVLNGMKYMSARSVNATQIVVESYYVSRYDFLGGAVAVVLLAFLSVGFIFHGWWHIGRPTTLSPLETAKAFGAPLLAECNSNATIKEIVRCVNDKHVRYGVGKMDDLRDDVSMLQLAEGDEVYTPRSGMAFQR
ncbi:hypothetical protein PVAG01_09092 [Phlyctema vagabunda]|uniref:Uncharacterized protein n=1 Tax=Phlyctema vagabunda TaxID=108571 RepID=A0ABR4P6D2_9HELO